MSDCVAHARAIAYLLSAMEDIEFAPDPSDEHDARQRVELTIADAALAFSPQEVVRAIRALPLI